MVGDVVGGGKPFHGATHYFIDNGIYWFGVALMPFGMLLSFSRARRVYHLTII